jgi:uncharacterized protein YcfL
MKEMFHGHSIEASAWHVPKTNQWKTTVLIYWYDSGGLGRKSFLASDFNVTFATEEEARIYGHQFARKWIDDGKPA